MLRAYQPDDWNAVREIYDLSKPDEMRGVLPLASIPTLNAHPEMLALFRESEIVVAEEDGKILGFAGHRGSYISWLFVHPCHRRQGVASSLVEAVLKKIDGKATLNVAKGNEAACRLYAQMGFVTEKEFVGHLNGHPCEVMRLSYEPSAA